MSSTPTTASPSGTNGGPAPGRNGGPAPDYGDYDYEDYFREGFELLERAREKYGRDRFDSLPMHIQMDGMMTVLHGECIFKGHAMRNDWILEEDCAVCKPCDCDGALDEAHCVNSCAYGSECNG